MSWIDDPVGLQGARRFQVEAAPLLTLTELLEALPAEIRNFDRAELNGWLTIDALDCLLRPGDSLRLLHVPRDVGFNPLDAAIEPIIDLATSAVPPGLFETAEFFLTGPIATGLAQALPFAAVGGGLYGALTALARSGTTGDRDAIEIARFGAIDTRVFDGTPIPIVLGQHLSGGIRLEGFTREVSPFRNELNALIMLGEGPMEEVGGITADEDDIDASDPRIAGKIRLNGEDVSSFSGAKFYVRMGNQDQSIIPLGGEDTDRQTTNSVTVAQEIGLNQGNAATHTTTIRVHGFRLKVFFPLGLFHIDRHGDVRGEVIFITYRFRKLGAASWTTRSVTPGFMAVRNAFALEYEELGLELAKYEIEIWRTNAAGDNIRTFSDARLETVDEILNYASSWPFRVLLGIKALATDQLQGGFPNVQVLCRGLQHRTWSAGGGWSTSKSWSQNNAWISAELLTNTRIGAGTRIGDADLFGQEFKDWADHCDAQVDIVAGGAQEDRHHLDAILTEERPLWSFLVEQAANAGAILVRQGRSVRPMVDQPGSSVHIFGRGSIKPETFSTHYVPLDQQFNVLEASFRDQDRDYEISRPPKEDDSVITGESQAAEKKIDLAGITRMSEVMRLLIRTLNQAKLIRKGASFEVNEEGLSVGPGELVDVQHELPGWGDGDSGLVVSATSTTVTLDRDFTLEPGTSYAIIFRHLDNTLEQQDIQGVATTSVLRTLTIDSGSWTTTPTKGTPFIVGSTTLLKKQFRVRAVRIRPNQDVAYRVIEQQDGVESNTPAALPSVSDTVLPRPGALPPDVLNLKAIERITRAKDGTQTLLVDVTFQQPQGYNVRGAKVWWRELGNTTWIPGGETDKQALVLRDPAFATGTVIEVAVTPVSIFGTRKNPEDVAFTAVNLKGDTERPPDVTNFYAVRISDTNTFTLRWDPVTDADGLVPENLAGYRVKRSATSPASWQNATVVERLVPGTQMTTLDLPPGTWTLMIKAVTRSAGDDGAGVESDNEASLVLALPARANSDPNLIETTSEFTEVWTGTKTKMTVQGGSGYLKLDAGETTGRYVSPIKDLNRVTRTKIYANLVPERLDTTTVDDITTAIDDTTRTIDGDVGDASLRFTHEYRWSDFVTQPSADESVSANWDQDWVPFVSGAEIIARWVQFRIVVTVDPDISAQLQEHEVTYDPPFIDEGGEATINGTGGADSITLAKPFKGGVKSSALLPKIQARITDGNAGDYAEISNVSLTGFDAEPKDSGGTSITANRTMEYEAVGV